MSNLTIGDVLADRETANRTLKLYVDRRYPALWVAEDEERVLWLFPAEHLGWESRQRKAWSGDRAALREVDPRNAYGTGWPGLSPPN
jgi:hypothetical protein